MTFSQTVTNDSLVCIKPKIAREIAADLIRYDECKEIVTINDSTIQELNSIVFIQNESIDILTELNKTQGNRVKMLESEISKRDVVILQYKDDLRKASNWKRVYGLGFAVSLTTAVVIVLVQ